MSHSELPHQPSLVGLRNGLLWSCGLLAIWCVLLPGLARTPAVARHLQWLDEQGIDPSAMYYTELEVMKPILARLNDPSAAGSRDPFTPRKSSSVQTSKSATQPE